MYISIGDILHFYLQCIDLFFNKQLDATILVYIKSARTIELLLGLV